MIDQTEDLQVMLRLIDEIARGHGRLTAMTDTFAAPGAPTGLMRTVLTSIVRAPIPPTVPQIGRSLGHSRQVIQRLADSLVAEDLAAWIDNPDHKLARRLVPTNTGRATYTRSAEVSRVWATAFADRFGRSRIEETVATLRDVRRAIEDELRVGGTQA